MKKANAQKNTLLKNAQANAESNFFKRVFFSPTQEEIQIIFFATLRFFNYLFFQRTVRNRTDIALNVNRFEQTVSELQTVVLRTNSTTAANIRLKEILKRRALFGNQTVVLLTGSGALTNSGASNPFFLKLL
jgi:hypothetical protein